VAAWLGYDFVGHNFLQKQRDQFCALGGFYKRYRLMMSVLWSSRVWSIWKERNGRIFQQKVESMQTLLELSFKYIGG